MGFLNKLFGGGTSLEGLRKAVEQKRFADARMQAEELLAQSLPEADAAEVTQLQTAAGDGLARLNLEEGLSFQRAGDVERAEEHFALASEQVCSAELRTEIETAVAASVVTPIVAAPEKNQGGGSCASCGPQEMEPLDSNAIEFPDSESQFELILTSYPPQLAERYRQKGELFLQAFMLSHSGQDEEALTCWQKVPAGEQDVLYWFELGSAQVRGGKTEQGQKSLEKALQINPGFLPATEILVQLLISQGETESALTYLQQLLEQGQDPAFCHVQLALVRLQQQQPELALGHARQALAVGVTEGSFLQMTASLLEQAGEMEEAEAVLRRLPAGGGCGGGGMSLPLAEFLLRQERDLGRILDSFNDACRKEPQNPRWQLRVAQTYMARNWTKEGLKILNKVIGDPQLDPELQQEAELLLASQNR